jgi:hypothetical protein
MHQVPSHTSAGDPTAFAAAGTVAVVVEIAAVTVVATATPSTSSVAPTNHLHNSFFRRDIKVRLSQFISYATPFGKGLSIDRNGGANRIWDMGRECRASAAHTHTATVSTKHTVLLVAVHRRRHLQDRTSVVLDFTAQKHFEANWGGFLHQCSAHWRALLLVLVLVLIVLLMLLVDARDMRRALKLLDLAPPQALRMRGRRPPLL